MAKVLNEFNTVADSNMKQHSKSSERFPHVPVRPAQVRENPSENRLSVMRESYKSLLELAGEDPSRQGLVKTPDRAAKAFLYFTKGYEESIAGNNNYTKTSVALY